MSDSLRIMLIVLITGHFSNSAKFRDKGQILRLGSKLRQLLYTHLLMSMVSAFFGLPLDGKCIITGAVLSFSCKITINSANVTRFIYQLAISLQDKQLELIKQ